jgi:hypothetical protein
VIRTGAAALLTLLTLGACRIERTPAEYFDQHLPTATEREQSRDELRSRILAAVRAFEAGDAAAGAVSLGMRDDSFLILPDAPPLRADELHIPAPETLPPPGAAVEVHELEVVMGPRGSTAWFLATGASGGEELRATGVYLRVEGSWRLSQLHLSRAAAPASVVSGVGAGT